MNEMRNERRSRRRWSAQERQHWLERLEKSGIGLSRFCKEHGLNKTTVSNWRQRAKQAGRREAVVVEVPASQWVGQQAPAGVASVTVSLWNGLELQVRSGTDVQWLSGLVSALHGVGGVR
jgi:hypothetical protein